MKLRRSMRKRTKLKEDEFKMRNKAEKAEKNGESGGRAPFERTAKRGRN